MRRLAFLLPLTLGALSALGFAPWSWWPITLIAFAVLLFLIHEAPTRRRALTIGWLFGVGHFAVANWWIQQPFAYQDAMPAWLGYVGVALIAMYLAVYPMLAAGLAWRFSATARGDLAARPDAAFVAVAGAAWIVTEYLRGTMFTGYPWDPLSVIWIAELPVARVAALVGTYALSGLTVVASGALMLLAVRRWWLSAVVAMAVAIAVVIPPPSSTAPPHQAHIRVVQPNLAQEERPTESYAEDNFQALAKLAGKPDPNHPRLIVWPEGAIRFALEDGYPRYVYTAIGGALMGRARIAMLLGDNDLVLTGTQTMYFDKRTENMTAAANSIVAVGPDARLHGRYDKAHLVPYGEYLALPWLLEPLGLSRLVPGDMDFVPGPGPRTLALPGFGKVGMLICYEVIFSGATVDPANRPDVIFNPSNDAWFGELGPPAHLAQAQLRAIEEGLPIVRSTPTGISAIIAADGRILASIPMHKGGAIEAPVPPAFAPTLFSRLGNWMAAIVAALLVILAIAIRRRARYGRSRI
jgi:apolipoprotein N-acyltransferase